MKAPKVKRITVADYLRNPTPENYERLVEQVRRKLCLAHRVFTKVFIGWTNGTEYKADACTALRAIGITPRSGGKGRK